MDEAGSDVEPSSSEAEESDKPALDKKTGDLAMHGRTSEGWTSTHWGQGVVYWTGTLQVHCKEMDNVPTIYLPGTLQVHPEFSKPIPLQCSSPGHGQYIHSVPSHVTAMSPLGN